MLFDSYDSFDFLAWIVRACCARAFVVLWRVQEMEAIFLDLCRSLAGCKGLPQALLVSCACVTMCVLPLLALQAETSDLAPRPPEGDLARHQLPGA